MFRDFVPGSSPQLQNHHPGKAYEMVVLPAATAANKTKNLSSALHNGGTNGGSNGIRAGAEQYESNRSLLGADHRNGDDDRHSIRDGGGHSSGAGT